MDYLEKRLLKLRSHPNLSMLYDTVPFHTQRIIEGILETGVTLPLMEQASQCMDEEFTSNVVLQILANGNVLLIDSVTDAALDEIEYLLESVYDESGC
jgi:hypothetical protein